MKIKNRHNKLHRGMVSRKLFAKRVVWGHSRSENIVAIIASFKNKNYIWKERKTIFIYVTVLVYSLHKQCTKTRKFFGLI